MARSTGAAVGRARLVANASAFASTPEARVMPTGAARAARAVSTATPHFRACCTQQGGAQGGAHGRGRAEIGPRVCSIPCPPCRPFLDGPRGTPPGPPPPPRPFLKPRCDSRAAATVDARGGLREHIRRCTRARSCARAQFAEHRGGRARASPVKAVAEAMHAAATASFLSIAIG